MLQVCWRLQHFFGPKKRACRNDITLDNAINWKNDMRDTVDNYVNSVDYLRIEA